MKYLPSLPEQNHNVSDTHPLKELVVLLGGIVVLAIAAYWCLGVAVDALVERMSTETETAIYKSMAFTPPLAPAQSAARQLRVRQLVADMQRCAGMAFPANVHLIDAKEPNAMVVPSGHVLVFAGLLDQVKSENGLAFVLAHELAHLKHRDHFRAMGRSLVLLSISALLSGDSSGLASVLAPAGQLGQASYSRERESAADEEALRVLQCHYGHAGGATEFFESLRDEDAATAGLSHYFASHPAMQTRIDDLRRAIQAGAIPVHAVRPLALP